MNLNAIKSLCAGGKRATVYNSLHGGQWISNGFGAWLVGGVRIEDEAALMELWDLSDKARGKAALMELWDLSDKARGKAVLQIVPATDRRMTWRDFPGEEELTEIGIVAMSDDASYIGLRSTQGLLFVDGALLRPVRADYRRYFARWEYGRPLVAVYDDLTRCVALLLPVANITADSLRNVANELRAAPYHWPDPEKEAADAEEAAEALFREECGEDGGAGIGGT